MIKSIVELNTKGLSKPVSIHAFQFGTIPAGQYVSFKLVTNLVQGGSTGQEIFWIEQGISIPDKQCVRFNLRFEVNVHNSADLQICLTHQEQGPSMLWRWSAPIGFTGKWSNKEQQAPWYDDKMDYCINISPSSNGIKVSLSEHVGSSSEHCAVIPENNHPITKSQGCG